MNLFKLIHNSNTLYRSRSGSITAEIVIQIEDFLFPGKGWSDFIVVIFGWWWQAITQALNSSKGVGSFMFMDGPYKVDVKKINEEQSELTFFEERRTEIIKHVSVVETNSIINELYRVSKEVIKSCDKNGWSSDDIDLLKRETRPQEQARSVPRTNFKWSYAIPGFAL